MLVPDDPATVDMWFQLGFGQQHAHGVREVPPIALNRPQGVSVRRAGPADLDTVVMLDLVLPEYQAGPPVFSEGRSPRRRTCAGTGRRSCPTPLRHLHRRARGSPVGSAVGAPAGVSAAHSGLARPESACILGFAATLPEYRGRGVGVALTEAIFEWARKGGYPTIVVDWRVTNLLSSRFWPRRGFRQTFVRLYRSIP